MRIQARKDKCKMKAHRAAAAGQQVQSEHAKHPGYQENMGPQSDVSMQGTSYQDDNSATPQKNIGLSLPSTQGADGGVNQANIGSYRDASHATQSTAYSAKTIEPKSKKKIEPRHLEPGQPIPPSLADADKEQHLVRGSTENK